jgi:hypothetical protein
MFFMNSKTVEASEQPKIKPSTLHFVRKSITRIALAPRKSTMSSAKRTESKSAT